MVCEGAICFKQYIKNKPILWGIKVFALCCAHTAHLWNCAFYLGKKVEDEIDQQKENFTTPQVNVCQNLVALLQGKIIFFSWTTFIH